VIPHRSIESRLRAAFSFAAHVVFQDSRYLPRQRRAAHFVIIVLQAAPILVLPAMAIFLRL
jgi:hypothetical protein